MKVEEIQAAICEEGVDGWLFFDHHRRDPLAYRILGLPDDMNPTRRWYYLIPKSGEPAKLVHRIEPHSLDALPGTTHMYSRWNEQFDELTRLLQGPKRLAMQYSPNCAIPYVSMVDGGTVELITRIGVQLVSSANLVQAFEARWSSDQLQMHLDTGKVVDEIRAEAFGRIAAGTDSDEWAVRTFIRKTFAARGLQTDHGPIVAVNDNASNPHYEPTKERNRPIRSGDLVLIDMWAKLDKPASVYYDITWTGFCGPVPTPEMLKVFDVVAGARDCAIELVKKRIKSGRDLRGFEVDDAARTHIYENGYGEYFIHRTGHSIGTDVHGAGANMDNYETHDERRVVADTCFSVEPGVYLPNFGIRSEVNIYVNHREAKVTGQIQRELLILG